MCGIAGSSDFEKAFNLYKLNLHRGSYSSGLMALDTKTGSYFQYKQQKAFEDNERESLTWKIGESKNDFNYFLFHSRAPTNSTETQWSVETTHPFTHDNCHVAHNGIITNFQELNKDLNFKVDTQIIPYNLIKTYNIQETYSNLQGLLTSWIVWGKSVHVVKAGSSLWMDKDSFSSSKFEGSHCVEEDGVIFDYKNGKFEKSGNFPYTNIYFL
jgi:glucosamine 6-phosphate synthetase-like amidotransferase/phosphosugar isomerase protein